MVPLICPTCQNVFAGSLNESMPATPKGYFAWGCFRYFSLEASTASVQPSKRLGNLAQARRTIRVKSAGARRLLDHPIGRNEHGDRVGGGVILGQPGQRATRSAA